MTDTTTVSLPGALGVAGVAFALVMTTSSTLPLISGAENLPVFKESVISNPTTSCNQNLSDAVKTWQEMRAARIEPYAGNTVICLLQATNLPGRSKKTDFSDM